MNNKERIFRILLVISGIACGLLLAPAQIGLLLVFALFGGLFGWLSAMPVLQQQQARNHLFVLGCAVLAAVPLWLASAGFMKKWSYTSSVASAAGMLHLSLDAFLQLARAALVVVSLPAITNLVRRWILWLGAHLRCLQRVKVIRMALSAVFANHFFKRLLKAAACILGSALCGVLLLALVYLLPTEQMDRNVASSAPTLAAEGQYYTVYSWCTSILDNYSDSFMLLEAAYDSSDSLLSQVMLVNNGQIKGEGSHGTLVQHYINGQAYDGSHSYARYWHGYLVLLKPLLLVMNYNSIRVLNFVIQLLLSLWVCILLWKKKSIGHALAWFGVYLLLMPVALGKSLQFSACYYVFTCAVLVLLSRKNVPDDNRTALIFLFTGIATAYFDFLTYPMATFGIPAVVWLTLHPGRSAEQKIAVGVRLFLTWCVGYGGMWASKWVIASLCSNENVILDALQQVLYRSGDVSSDGVKTSMLNCIRSNLYWCFRTPATLLIIAFAAALYVKASRGNHNPALSAAVYCDIIPYSVVGLFPFLWYAFTVNHSGVHTFFTNKSLSVLALAVLFALADAASLRSASGGLPQNSLKEEGKLNG